MIRLANVLIVESRDNHAQSLQERLQKDGYHTFRALSGDDGIVLAQQDRPDLILIGQPGDNTPIAALKQFQQTNLTADVPQVILTAQDDPAFEVEALNARADDVIALTCSDIELSCRLRPLFRLSTMHGELELRTGVADDFSIAPSPVADQAATKRAALILLVGDAAKSLAEKVLPNADITTSSDLFEAEHLLSQRNYDAAFIAFSGSQPSGVLDFCAQLRNNPRLFNLPVVLQGNQEVEASYRHGVTRVLPADASGVLCGNVVTALARRQRLRWAIYGTIQSILRDSARDKGTGSYSRAFFDAYLERRLEAAKARHRHLSLIFFSAPNINDIRTRFGDDAANHLKQQMGQWITGLLRAEDLVSAYAENEFCAVLPDTTLAEAEVAMHRIVSVLTCTDFAVRDVYQPIKLWAQAGCTNAVMADTAEILLGRARTNANRG